MTGHATVSIFKEASEIAAACPDRQLCDLLRDRIAEARECYDLLTILPTREHMVALVAAWTRLLRAIDAIPPLGDDGPPQNRLPKPKGFDEVKALLTGTGS